MKIIVFENEKGIASICTPNQKLVAILDADGEDGADLIAKMDVPCVTVDGDWMKRDEAERREVSYNQQPYSIIDSEDLTEPMGIFANAVTYKPRNKKKLAIDMAKAREEAHRFRRMVRSAKLEPWDRMATAPTEFARAEAERETIRSRDAQVQTDIDNATTPEQMRQVIAPYIQEA